MIGTGGTIASKQTDNGLAPALSSEELIANIPDIGEICEVDCVQPISLDSTNITPAHWMVLANVIKENYDKYDGFVITHGTDTLAYTAAGISYLIQNSPKPIVLTGAQRPLGAYGSDAGRNILDSLIYACDDASCDVTVVFSGSVICGTRARKNYSKSFMAFASVNFPELAKIIDSKIVRFVPSALADTVTFFDRLDTNVGLLKLTPGMNNDVMRYAIDKYDGLVIESFGVGGIPEYSDFYVQIKHAVGEGKLIVMTTQVPNEGSDLSLYRVGNVVINNLKVLEAHDMTSEAVFAKLMWILGITGDYEKAKELFYSPVHHDILYV